ncbi:MAG: TIGR00159 family protein, partial [Duncaniella sp.]|nr:TIGR00159 family protein [Duncaniella sp.]
MDHFGIKDALDIAVVALLLYYLYKIMKESGTLNIFFGVLAFIVVWVLTSQILELKLLGSILDQFMG